VILRQIAVDRDKHPDAWYFGVPSIAQLAREPLRLMTGVTVIVGENGSGKSTFLEAVASAWRSKLPYAVKHWGAHGSAEDTDLHWALTFDAEHPRPGGGCFLRAEAMHQLFTAGLAGDFRQVYRPHITIGYRNIDVETFKKIMEDYTGRLYSGSFVVDNVRLWKHEAGYWNTIAQMNLLS